MYMTNAQLKLAKSGHAFLCTIALVSGDSLCVHKVGVGVVLVMLGGSMLSLARASITLAKTYMTICWFTLGLHVLSS